MLRLSATNEVPKVIVERRILGVIVQQVIARLRELGATRVEELHGEEEGVVFKLPDELAAG